jgi:Cu/Ag efflux protein CusF
MKTMFTRAATSLAVVIVGLVWASPTFADDAALAAAERATDKLYKGTVTAIDAVEKTVSVKGTLFSKTFNASDACKVSLEDKPEAALSDLRVGQKVEVRYQNAQGVLVAAQILQHNLTMKGHITKIDPDKRLIAVKSGMSTRELRVADNCSVLLKDKRVGTLENLKVGHTINLAYDPADGALTARKIEQKAETFVGTIQALDAGTKTVKARSLMSERKFNLAAGCRIVVANKPDASLRDLRIGDKVEFSYEDADGVLVANRIGRDANMAETENPHTAKLNKQ